MASGNIKPRLNPILPHYRAVADRQVSLATRGTGSMEALQLEKLCSWLKQRLVTSKQRYALNYATRNDHTKTVNKEERPREYPHTGQKRKITWEILHPFKHRRLEREEREPISTVHGNFGLAGVRGAVCPGRQSTATSLCAILRAQTTEPSSWTSDVIDKVLIQGDRLHSVRLDNFEPQPIYKKTLEPEELPTNICMNSNEYRITVSKVLPKCRPVDGVKCAKDDASRQHLCEILAECFKHCNSGFLMARTETVVAIFSDGTHAYLFNPNKKTSRNILLGSRRLSALQKFRDAKHLATYLLPKPEGEETVRLWRVNLLVDCMTWSKIPVLPHQPWV